MPDRRPAIVDLAMATLRDRRRLLALSRPAAWPIAAVPFALCAIEAERTITAAVVLGTLYFLLPFALLRHGLADPDPTGTTRAAIAVTNLPIIAAVVLLGGPAAGMLLLLTVAVAVADATPPLRLRDRPGLDLAASGVLLALPAACGLALAGGPLPDHPWATVVALAVWGAASAAIEGIGDARQTGARSVVGDRGLAGLALVGYGTTAAIAVTIAGPGWLAAVALLTFVLLPLEVLLAPTVEAAARARVAWADLRGLIWLVGGWLAILLVIRWSGVVLVPWAVAIVVPTVTLGYAIANVLTTRVATRRHRPRDDERVSALLDATLTIVVPADDDATGLAATLVSVRSQTYPETTVAALATSGAAAREAASWVGDEAVFPVPPPPIGPPGTAWSWHTGVRTADTDLVLLLGPGVELAPIGARLLVEQRVRRGVDLLIGLARDAMPTSVERRSVPGFALWRIAFRPLWWAALTGGRPAVLATDAGPLLLIRRDPYLDLGDGAIRAATGADPSLEHAFAAAGRPVGIVQLVDLAAVRREPTTAAVLEEWRRDVALAGGELARALLMVVVLAVAYVAPLVLPISAVLMGTGPVLLGAACVPLAALLVLRLVLALTQRQPLTTIVWHPVTVAIVLSGLAIGVADHVRGHRHPNPG